MNILHSTGMLFPTKYGSFERWLVEVSRQACAAGHKVFIAYQRSCDNVDVYTKAVEGAGAEMVVLENDAQIDSFCAGKKIDIVHFHFDFQSHGGIYRRLNRKNVKLFATLHCECGYYVDKGWRKGLLSFVRVWRHRIKTCWRARYFEKILACSHMVEQQYRAFYWWRKQKSQCLYLGIQPAESLGKKENLIPMIVCIAFHSPIKGVDVLLHALRLLKERGVNFKCLQIGGGSSELNGEDTQKLKTLCTELDLNDRVVWTGLTNDVNKYLSCADVYCQPSRTEAICLSIAEAMEFSLPIVASNVGGIPELVRNGENGWLVRAEDPKMLADRLEIFLKDKDLRDKMGEKSKDRLKKLSFYQVESAEKLLKLYQEK